MPEDVGKHGSIELVDRSAQCDNQQVSEILNKAELKRNKVREQIIKQGNPICPTNFCVVKPCFIIIFGLVLLIAISYYDYS
jgi:hypothetical protein